MKKVITTQSRRAFLKSAAISGGGMLIGFQYLSSCAPRVAVAASTVATAETAYMLNGYIKIMPSGKVIIMSPNPEIGQGVKTSMPMLVAEELDARWGDVVVEQAGLNTQVFKNQIAGGSQSIRSNWRPLRTAGAAARQMLRQAAAQAWQVPLDEVTTSEGVLYHLPSQRRASYGEMAAAAARLPVPEHVELKHIRDFKIIGTSRLNVDGHEIVQGKHIYGLDYRREGMLYAMIIPPPFGMQPKTVDDGAARQLKGIRDIFIIDAYDGVKNLSGFDNTAFRKLVVVVGETTWQVMKAKKLVQIEWELAPERLFEYELFGRKATQLYPQGLESTDQHRQKIATASQQTAQVVRKDGDPETAFRQAARVVERTYTAPFLPHNCMEPMNFFAHVTDDRCELVGNIQTPEFLQKSVAERLGLSLEKVDLQMTRMGGGFGRRLYGHYVVEAAVISKIMKAPVKLVYSREDDMSSGIYRPMYHAIYRAALDSNNRLIGLHIRAGGIPESPLAAHRFPAGAVDNYLAESWSVPSNISVGAFRAPRSNFIACAEQSFLDELAEITAQDPIQMRLDMLERAKNHPVGSNNDYDPDRYAGVIKLVRDKSNWHQPLPAGWHRGVAAYFCHNSYVAQVVEMRLNDGVPVVEKVYCAVDCGIVVNPTAAVNLCEGSIVDGIGHALYGELTFADGKPQQQNFNTYHQIRHHEAPKSIEVFFVENETDPTGMGEPPFPPVFGAVANALARTMGRRYYHQPFLKD